MKPTHKLINGQWHVRVGVEWIPETQERQDAARTRLTEMLTLRQAPAVYGDTEMFRGAASADPFANVPVRYKEAYRQKAKELGVSTEGKRYVGGLVKQRGEFDPEALVSDSSDMKRVLESRGWGTEEGTETIGGLKVKAAEIDLPDPGKYQVSPAIVNDRIADMALDNPDILRSNQKMNDLRDQLTTQLSGTQD